MILGIDLEGELDLITELGMAVAGQSLSCQWGPAAKRLVKKTIRKAEYVAAHNGLGFDFPGLEAEGVKVPVAKQFDTMVAFGLLYPNELKRLGAAAPVLCPLEPWKHLDQTDPQRYNRMDAVVLVPMAEKLMDKLRTTGLWDLFWNIEQPFARLAISLEKKGVWCGPSSTKEHVRYRSRRMGKGALVDPSGAVESHPQICWPGGQRGSALAIGPPPAGRLYSLRKPDLSRLVVEALAEGKARESDRRIDLHLAGRGPQQIQKELGLKPPWTAVRAITDEWESFNPWYSRWKDRVGKQAKKDGYIVNPFGRRAYTRTQKVAVEFLVQSTVSDIWKRVALEHGTKVYAVLPDGIAVTERCENCDGFGFDCIPLSLTLEPEEL